jgi:EmrB/QacA subfamily drug resistance transporter
MKTPCDEAAIRAADVLSPCGPKQGRWVLAATILGSSMAFIDSTVVNVALPALQNSFGATVVGVQWVVESYALTLGALILVGGSMGDLFGRRRVFLLGIGLFAVSSIACGLAASIAQLIAARAVQGVGAAFLVPGSLALISASFDERERGRAIGTWSGATAITTAIGPVLGGWLMQHFSWRWAFFINVPLALAVVVIGLWRVPESRSAHREGIDWLGAVVATVGLSGLVFGFIESANLGWSPQVIAAIAGGVLAAGAFLRIEARAKSPMVPLTLFRSPEFRGANLLTLFMYAAVSVFFFLLPMNLIQVQSYSPTAAGAAMLPMILLMFFLSRWSGGLVARYGARLPLIVGPLIVAAGYLVCSLPSAGGSYWTTFFPGIVVLGFGLTVSVAPLTTVVMEAVDDNRAGTASGINNAASRVAGLLAVALVGVVMTGEFRGHLIQQLQAVPIPGEMRHELQSNADRLAALVPPSALQPQVAAEIRGVIAASFVSAFRLVMWICALLALASATTAWRMIPALRRPADR